MTGHSRLRPLLSAAVVLAPLCAGTAQAQERGEFMRDALSGIGLLEKRQDPIDYHERPPLVMPPKIDGKALPQPRAPDIISDITSLSPDITLTSGSDQFDIGLMLITT